MNTQSEKKVEINPAKISIHSYVLCIQQFSNAIRIPISILHFAFCIWLFVNKWRASLAGACLNALCTEQKREKLFGLLLLLFLPLSTCNSPFQFVTATGFYAGLHSLEIEKRLTANVNPQKKIFTEKGNVFVEQTLFSASSRAEVVPNIPKKL